MVLGIYELSTGGDTVTVADPKLVFMAALKANARNIILSHNHPSGTLNQAKKMKNWQGGLQPLECIWISRWMTKS